MTRFVRENLAFLVLGAALVIYVALCTHWRDEKTSANAWEHHRTIVALVEQVWMPGNPTFAIAETSIRYSPYTVAQALICRSTGWSPYHVLSGAAVFNTVLLVAGVWCLLRAFGEEASAASVLAVMVVLYGVSPGYANSYALADLPWHQVNPSAFSYGLTLLSWALFLRAGKTPTGIVCLGILTGVATLDHVMTGLFTFLGMFLFALTVPSFKGVRAVASLGVIGAIAAGICLAWPWYPFLEAARTKRDGQVWFLAEILRLMLVEWAWPAYLCGLAAFSVPRPIVRVFLLGSAACLTISVADFALKSPMLGRLPMPAMIFLHVPIGIFCHEVGLFRPATWRGRLRALFQADDSIRNPAIIATTVALIYARSLTPQLVDILKSPHLARPYVSAIFRKEPKLLRYRAKLDGLLSGIGSHDVVLSDLETSWMIPSSRGRIVGALHFEFFVEDSTERYEDLKGFFEENTSVASRLATLGKYHVRWIVLNPERQPPRSVEDLMDSGAIVSVVDQLTLLDAEVWAQHHGSGAGGDQPPASPGPRPPINP